MRAQTIGMMRNGAREAHALTENGGAPGAYSAAGSICSDSPIA